MEQNKIKTAWEGTLFAHHSFAMVNRELLLELLKEPSLDLCHIPYEPDQFTPSARFNPLFLMKRKMNTACDFYIRHRWPPDFSRKIKGKHILFQPWEFGSIPLQWVKEIAHYVDEIWTYSNFVKDAYTNSHVDKKPVHVIPLGINPELFYPQFKPIDTMSQMIGNRYCFLFNGGVNSRKGTDILINAYLNEFKAYEPVCLFIKDCPFYQSPIASKVYSLSQRTDIPLILYTRDTLDPESLPGLYTASDCYVQPYRAEGFGLPIAEAMACGLPTIVTDSGACREFTNEETVYYIKSKKELFKEKIANGLPTVDYPFWCVPNTDHLRYLMRYVFENQSEAKEKGKKASDYVRQVHTWARGAESIIKRIRNQI